MGAKRDSDGFVHARATEPEGITSHRRVTEDDDVEGHAIRRRDAEGEGFAHVKATGDNDVEGNRFNRAIDPEGIASRRRATEDEDDVEGHSIRLRSPSSRGE